VMACMTSRSRVRVCVKLLSFKSLAAPLTCRAIGRHPESAVQYRVATPEDASALALLNHQLMRDEGYRNPMSVAELVARMRRWLEGEYRAVLATSDDRVLGEALYRSEPEHVYQRRLFVAGDARRGGVGRQLVAWLRKHAWPEGVHVRTDVLVGDELGLSFWRSVGFIDYCTTIELPTESGRLPFLRADLPSARRSGQAVRAKSPAGPVLPIRHGHARRNTCARRDDLNVPPGNRLQALGATVPGRSASASTTSTGSASSGLQRDPATSRTLTTTGRRGPPRLRKDPRCRRRDWRGVRPPPRCARRAAGRGLREGVLEHERSWRQSRARHGSPGSSCSRGRRVGS